MARPDREQSQLRGKALEEAQRFGSRLRTARKGAKLSQTVLGERLATVMGRHLPFSQAAISSLESGKMPVDTAMLAAAPQVFGVPSLEFAAPIASPREGVAMPEPERFQEWKQLVGLPAEFPHLLPLIGEQAISSFHVGANRVGLPERIAVGTGIDRLAVELQRGHGTTTLSQHTHETLKRESITRGVIPIHIGLDELDKDQFSQNPHEVVEGSIRTGVSQSLADEQWQMVMPDDALTAHRGLSQTGSFSELLANLRENMRIVSLQIDLSSKDAYFDPKSHGDKIGSLQRALIQIQGHLKQLGAFPGTLTEMYFGDKSSLEMVENFRGDFLNKLVYPWYRPLEVYEMLAARYTPSIEVVRMFDRWSHEGLISTHSKAYTRQEALGIVMSPDMLTGLVAPDIPLVESMRLLEGRLGRRSARLANSET